MDIASVLEEYLADISTLPGDIAFILDEIKIKDQKLLDAQKRIQQRDGAIQKFVKTNGASQEYSKEQAWYPKIRSDFQECISLQQDKTKLAIMGLYLITKHVSKLDSHVTKLEAEGQLAPVAADSEDFLSGQSMSPEPTPKQWKSSADSHARSHSRSESSRANTVIESRSRSRSSSVVSNTNATARVTHSTPLPTESPASSEFTKAAGGDPGAGTIGSGGSRQALEVNGARLSLKRSHQSPRQQRPPGLEERDEAFCYCKKGSVGNMIACDGENCEIEWFHWDCVGLTEDPKGSWYCPQCSEKVKKLAK